jgi:hypothetical protein
MILNQGGMSSRVCECGTFADDWQSMETDMNSQVHGVEALFYENTMQSVRTK